MRPLCLGATAVLCALALLLGVRPAAARVCLPPLFEGGQRLHPLGDVRVMWLEPLLRQHELCWRDGGDEVRIVLFGNSAVFGFPLPAQQSFASRINAQFDRDHVPAHVFNLGWTFTYQLRDAVILHEALAYDPGVIVYVLTLADMVHIAPTMYPPPLARFFELNTGVLSTMTEAPPAGLAEPFRLYQPVADRAMWLVAAERVRQFGYLAHIVAHQHADHLTRRLGATPRPERLPMPKAQPLRPCEETLQQNDNMYANFAQWNPLEYLADIRARSGRGVLVVNWPVIHEPQGTCYNRRYGAEWLARYNAWLAAEAERRGFAYLDLHDLLPAENFIDSLHLNAAGHEIIAARIAAALMPLVQARR